MKKSAAYLKIILSIASFLFIASFASAQENAFTAAEKLFEKGEYYSAAKLYEQFLLPVDQKTSENAFRPYFVNRKEATPKKADHVSSSRASWKLAESYRLVNDFANAEKWYKLCLEKYASMFPLVLYRYAVCLRANKNYTAAETALNDFLASYAGSDEYSRDARRELENLSFISAQIAKDHSSFYTISKLVIPSEGGCFAPGFINDSTMVFTSTQTDSSAFTGNKNPYKNRLFSSHIAGMQIQNAVPVNVESEDANQGAAAFLPGGKKMFFTQWEKKDGKMSAAIYVSEKNGNKWDKPQKLSLVNTDDYNSIQPAVSSDGKWLFFSSDKPGGAGNFDIWYAALDEKGNPSQPVNAGKQVNTAGDEKTPFYTASRHQLVFSTNGRTGFGGFDFFITNGSGINDWGNVSNMGMPFNSSKDDIYFFARESGNGTSEAYISSDRESACCLELYRVEKTEHNRIISGTLIDCNSRSPLSAANIYITTGGATKETIDSLDTNDSGRFVYTLTNQDSLLFVGSKQGYNLNRVGVKIPPVSTTIFETDSLLNVVICLEKITTDPIITGKDNNNEIVPGANDKGTILYFDFDKSALSSLSKEKLDAVVKKLSGNPGLIVEIGGYTDEKGTGEYNLDLGYKRAKAVAGYLTSSGISIKRITLKSFGECCPAQPEQQKDQSEKDKLDRRVQFIFSSKAD